MNIHQLIRQHSSFNPNVIINSLILMLVLILTTLFLPEQTNSVLAYLKQGIFTHFSWFYILICSVFLFFLLFLSISQLGDIKLGSDEEQPEFRFTSWLAMLFAAGMGVGLMFFGVAEPLMHVGNEGLSGSSDLSARQQAALLHTVFHWGVHGWTIYGLIALALAYFGFRYKLPLSLRSCFYPLFKDKINGKLGDWIDTVALISTLFGIITTLGYGAMQMGAGLQAMGWISENTFPIQLMIIVIVMSLAVASAASGLGKGVKLLSETNLVLALSLMLFILVLSPTREILMAFVNNLGIYLSNLVELSFKTYSYENHNQKWFGDWTVVYWAWWFSWAPFVGLFIARISRGRTIREFIFGVLGIPSLFCVLWFSIFGNSALLLDAQHNGALSALTNSPENLLFSFLNYFPLSGLSSFLALLIIGLFFITSADSGIYVLNNIASVDKLRAVPAWQTIMWGVMMAVISSVLMRSGGLSALQTMTLVVALPFALLMFIMCLGLWKGLKADYQYSHAKLTPTSTFWTGAKWRSRLNQMLSQNQASDVQAFLKETVLPAMTELQNELVAKYGLSAKLDVQENELSLIIHKETLRDFVYGVRSVERQTSEQLLKDGNLPHIQQTTFFEPITFFADGRKGYNVEYMTQEEVIADILKQYERYLSLLDNVGKEMLSHEWAN